MSNFKTSAAPGATSVTNKAAATHKKMIKLRALLAAFISLILRRTGAPISNSFQRLTYFA
jgi:hypothetical protein